MPLSSLVRSNLVVHRIWSRMCRDSGMRDRRNWRHICQSVSLGVVHATTNGMVFKTRRAVGIRLASNYGPVLLAYIPRNEDRAGKK